MHGSEAPAKKLDNADMDTFDRIMKNLLKPIKGKDHAGRT
jgi:hypothetical protein